MKLGSNLLAVLVAVLATLGTVRDGQAQSLYILSDTQSADNSTATNFGTVNLATGAYKSIATLAGGVNNLTWDSASNQFWVTHGFDGGTTLKRLSTTGILGPSVGTIGATVYGMDYRPSENRLYGFDYNNDRTIWIDPSTGSLTSINSSPGASSSVPLGGRYSILNDTIYMATKSSQSGLYTVDYNSGSATPVILDNLYQRMVLANDGTTMYGIYGNGTANQQQLYTINTSNGVLTPGAMITGANLGTHMRGSAFGPTAGTSGGGGVPEPGEWAAMGILGAGLTGLVLRKRRKG